MWRNKLFAVEEKIAELTLNDYCKIYMDDEINYWQDIAIWLFDDHFRGDKPINILDVGCGYGTLSAYSRELFPESNIISVDVVRYLSEDIKTLFKLNFYNLDIELDDIPNGNFDKIIFTEVLEHLYFNPIPTLQKLYNKLNDDGCIYISTPDSDSMWGRNDKFYNSIDDMPFPHKEEKPEFSSINEHIFHYNFKELKTVVNKAGFKIIKFSRTDREFRGNHFCLKLKKK